MRQDRTLYFCLATACLILGSAIYILFRPITLLMFHWADMIGLEASIATIRTWTDGFDELLPAWIIYSLPFALWVSSYLFYIKGVWTNSTSLYRHVWLYCIPIVAIAAELSQYMSIISGYFDIADLISLILVTALSIFTINFKHLIKGGAK